MLKILTETSLSYKAGITVASSPVVVSLLSALGWIGANISMIGLVLTALVALVTLIKFICEIVWQNRKNKAELEEYEEEGKLRDLQIEELKLKNKILELELKEKQEQ